LTDFTVTNKATISPQRADPVGRVQGDCLRMIKNIILLLALLPSAALAQQSTIYGADGKITGRVTTDSQGSKTIYGADGKITGRTSTGSNGTTTIYDASGRTVGSVTKERSK
jgi:YD repeat-containing protein